MDQKKKLNPVELGTLIENGQTVYLWDIGDEMWKVKCDIWQSKNERGQEGYLVYGAPNLSKSAERAFVYGHSVTEKQ